MASASRFLAQASSFGVFVITTKVKSKCPPWANIPIRDRSTSLSASLRKPEYLPPHEIKKAILVLVEANFGASHNQLPTEVARLFGFKATSAQLREVIEEQIKVLVETGKLQEMGDHLTIAEEVKEALG